MTSKESPLAAYDFLGWARHRLAIAQAEHASPYCRTDFHACAIETWTEVIRRIEAGDAIGLYGCAEKLPGLSHAEMGLLRVASSEEYDALSTATDEALGLGKQRIPSKPPAVPESALHVAAAREDEPCVTDEEAARFDKALNAHLRICAKYVKKQRALGATTCPARKLPGPQAPQPVKPEEPAPSTHWRNLAPDELKQERRRILELLLRADRERARVSVTIVDCGNTYALSGVPEVDSNNYVMLSMARGMSSSWYRILQDDGDFDAIVNARRSDDNA